MHRDATRPASRRRWKSLPRYPSRGHSEAQVLNDPNLIESPAPRPPDQGVAERRANADAGLRQIVVTSLLVIVAFAAGWFGNAFVNRASYVAPLTTTRQTNNEYLLVQAWDAITKHYVVTS